MHKIRAILTLSLVAITALACGTTASTQVSTPTTATAVATPTIAPTPLEEYMAMSEEELANSIDKAVTEADEAARQVATATEEAAADGAISEEESEEIEAYVAEADAAIAYTEELITAYYGLYGELAVETIEMLSAIENDLTLLAESLDELDALLLEVETALDQGTEVADEALAELEASAQNVTATADRLQAQTQNWTQSLQAEMNARIANALSVQPASIAENRAAAIQSALDYAQSVRQSLADHRITQDELAAIAQLGANAFASLNAHGGAALQELAGSINTITAQIAGGQIPQAAASLESLENTLNSLPSRP